MTEEKTKTEKPKAKTTKGGSPDQPNADLGEQKRNKPNFRKRRGARERVDRRPEFDQKIIGIRRVVRVMAGGRRFSFSVAMVLGDKKGRVGVGIGKAGDTALAIQKAVRSGKKHMFTVSRTKTGSIPHNTEAKYGASVVEIRPAKGRGLVAGAAARTVLELAGVTDITAKILTRSKNKINIARATIIALKKLED